MVAQVKKIILFVGIVFLFRASLAQQCSTDSNYYSIFYNAPNNNLINGGIITPENELVALGQSSTRTSFVTKFTSQGNVIWSKEFNPDYPFVNWAQHPWYSDTQWYGITNSSDSTYYVYGSSMEHGKSVNNSEEPPTHMVGLLMNIDKYGKPIYCKYFGNWHTDYSIDNLIHLSNGGLAIFLRAHFFPYVSKILGFNKAGDIIWMTPLQASLPSVESQASLPL